jgi:hypothetical protein
MRPAFGHQPARAEDAAEAADLGHHVRAGHHYVELHEALVLDLGDVVVESHEVGAGLAGLGLLPLVGEDEHADGLAGSMRQRDRAAHHLVGMTGVDVQTHVHVDGLVEACAGRLLDDVRGAVQRQVAAGLRHRALDEGERLAEALAVLRHLRGVLCGSSAGVAGSRLLGMKVSRCRGMKVWRHEVWYQLAFAHVHTFTRSHIDTSRPAHLQR